jgi:hypothetical protein
MRKYCLLLTIASFLATAADNPAASWRKKPVAEWNEEDAKQVLTDSPWVKIAHLENLPDLPQSARREGGDWDAGVAKGVGIAGTGILGPTRMREARERAHHKPDQGSVLVRWESAVPVHAAEIKLGDMDGPKWQTKYYAIAVFDVPVPAHWRSEELKGIAFLKRFQKKDLKPSRVEVLRHEENEVDVVYYFSRSQELTKKDVTAVFQAQIGRVVVSQPFTIDEMTFEGNPEF